MQKEYSFHGIELTFPVKRAFSNCAQDIEKKVPGLEKLHFSIRKDPKKGGRYAIDLRAVSKSTDIVSSVETKNVYRGLKAIKHATVNKLREDRKRMIHKARRKSKNEQLKFHLDNYELKKAL